MEESTIPASWHHRNSNEVVPSKTIGKQKILRKDNLSAGSINKNFKIAVIKLF